MDTTVSSEMALNLDSFIGLTRIKSRLRKVEERVGLKDSNSTPSVTGNTDAAKLDSLITVLATLGIINDATT